MLFVVSLEVKGTSTPAERIARRAEWQYPAGVKVMAEYWLQTDGYSVISIIETDDNADIFAIASQWSDGQSVGCPAGYCMDLSVSFRQQRLLAETPS